MKKILLTIALLAALLLSASGHAQIGGGGTVNANNVTPGFFNLDPSMVPHVRGAFDRVRAGTGRGTILAIGDSTTAGGGSGTSGNTLYVNARPNSWPVQLARYINNYAPAWDGSIQGDQAMGAALGATGYGQYDTRTTLNSAGVGWATTASIPTLGGSMFKYTSGGGSGTLSFTPVQAFDTIKIQYAVTAGQGSFQTNIDGAASLGTTATAGANAYSTVTYTVAKATHTVNIVAQNDGQLLIGRIWTYDSTIPAIDVLNAGINGMVASTGTVATQPWSYLNVIGTVAPDACLFDLTINDSNNNGLAGLSSWSSSLQTMATACKVSGDVIFMVGPPSNTANATNGVLDQYVSALYALAGVNAAPVVNFKALWTSYAVKNAITPYAPSDNLHPTALGYSDMAAAIMVPLLLGNAAQSGTGSGQPVLQISPTVSGHLNFQGNTPTLSACGGGSPAMAAGSTDNSGSFTVGTVTGTCTLTFAKAFTTSVRCVVQSQTTLAAFGYSYNLTSITTTATTLGGDVVDYRCDGGP